MKFLFLSSASLLLQSSYAFQFFPSSRGTTSARGQAIYSSNPALDLIKAAQGSASAPTKSPSDFIFDDAAKLAYADHSQTYNLPQSDASFKKFLPSYLSATIENVKSQERKMTVDENFEVTNINSAPPSSPTAPLTEAAIKSAKSQMDASESLSDAFDELSEEEEALAKELGLESVEELEVRSCE